MALTSLILSIQCSLRFKHTYSQQTANCAYRKHYYSWHSTEHQVLSSCTALVITPFHKL